MLPVPEGWSFREAAGLFVTAPTSYGALVVRAGVKKGDYVLVHAAAGGVGLAAVQGMFFPSFLFELLSPRWVCVLTEVTMKKWPKPSAQQ